MVCTVWGVRPVSLLMLIINAGLRIKVHGEWEN